MTDEQQRSVVVTRTREQASELSALLKESGREVIEIPTICFEDPLDFGPVDEAIDALDTYDWLVFLSATAVERFLDRVAELEADLARVKIAAAGSATAAALQDCNVGVDLIPTRFTSESLLDALVQQDIAGKWILLPRGDRGRRTLPDGLEMAGAIVNQVEAYRTMPEPAAEAMIAQLAEMDPLPILSFASSQTVRNFCDMADAHLPRLLHCPVACIGPITEDTAIELGFASVSACDPHTIPALAELVRGMA
jgi:uroporphyrinogen III methyltransferase/synthase